MSHVYYTLLANKDDLNVITDHALVETENNKFFVPIIHVESDNKDEIRETLIKQIDSILKLL
jgi:hypothetical protein